MLRPSSRRSRGLRKGSKKCKRTMQRRVRKRVRLPLPRIGLLKVVLTAGDPIILSKELHNGGLDGTLATVNFAPLINFLRVLKELIPPGALYARSPSVVYSICVLALPILG